MNYYVQIRCSVPGFPAIAAFEVPRSVQLKYDYMISQNLAIWITPFGQTGQIELITIKQGYQLAQKIVEHDEAQIIKGFCEMVDGADIPKLLKLFEAELNARLMSGKRQ